MSTLTFLRRLEGKVAIITGGASGIGESTARLFSRHGAKVVIADIQDEIALEVCKDLGSTFVHCDVTKESDVEAAVDKAVATYGKLDIMFNNAGIIGALDVGILNSQLSDFKRVVDVNLVGVFLGTKHASRVMIPNKSGSIISTASVSGVIGGVGPHAYAGAKHGVVGLMKNAAVELGRHGIRANCVSPYIVSTPLARAYAEESVYLRGLLSNANLKGVVLEPEDMAEAALYLASDESRYVSGHNLVVDGGASTMNQGCNMFDFIG